MLIANKKLSEAIDYLNATHQRMHGNLSIRDLLALALRLFVSPNTSRQWSKSCFSVYLLCGLLFPRAFSVTGSTVRRSACWKRRSDTQLARRALPVHSLKLLDRG